MRSSSAEPAGRTGAGGVGRDSWLRLAAALVIGATAIVVPWAGSHLDRTGAVFTDHAQSSADLFGGPTPTPTPTPTPSPSPTDTSVATPPTSITSPSTASLAAQSLKGQPRTPKATSKTP